ncbi:MAG TPA: hypothetical protein VF407_11195, partial [Polyangiaceae bacterium]
VPPRKRETARARAAAAARTAAQAPAPPSKRDTAAVELRLAIGPAGVGIELGKEARLGPLRVTSLSVALPTTRFPVDVSGGVSRFRHKRGTLRELSLEVDLERAKKWGAREVRGIVAAGTSQLWLAVAKHGASIAVADEEGKSVLALDVAVEARGDSLAFYPLRARGVGLPAPASALAIAALEALAGKTAVREGAAFVVESAVDSLARALLPEAGARAPETADVKWTSIAPARDAWILHASHVGAPFEPHALAARAHETAALLRAADDALHARQYDEARHLALALLERAPRHPEIVARIAEIDQHVGSRAESALGLVGEAERDPEFASPLRWARAALLAETGDVTGAIAAFASAAEREDAPVLAARGFEAAADLSTDPIEALAWIDRAVARTPSSRRLVARRLDLRLGAGRLDEAMADAERLEAQARGAKERYRAWMDVANAYKKAGFSTHAATFFERALRFAPDDVDALSGLGHALVREGRAARGVALLARALDLADALLRKGSALPEGYWRAVVELAEALADAMGDRPAAVARVRSVPNDVKEAPLARLLEGRWRADLGDLAGASLAFARLRELAEEAPAGTTDLVPFLREAATFEEAARGDVLAAHRFAALALRLAPNDPTTAADYKRIAAKIPGLRAPAPVPAREAESAEPPSTPAPITSVSEEDLATLDARADELARKLQADASNEAVADELAAVLTKLGRDMEMFALVSARVEDAPDDTTRAKWLPRQIEVLKRLENAARAAGEEHQALFYADARARIGG